ncbi:MAG TPA: hypothetical protein VF476_15280 [Chitinophagaceae bacterium]
MQFEDFDKRIKDAADHHHPAYNEKAWDKMKHLLDKNMPEEKKDRRRFIFFILVPLLLAGGVWMVISKPWEDKKAIAKTEQSIDKAAEKNSNDEPVLTGDEANTKNNTTTPATGDQTNTTVETAGNSSSDPDKAASTAGNDKPVIDKPAVVQSKPVAVNDGSSQFNAAISPASTKKKKKQAVAKETDDKIDTKEVVITNAKPEKQTDPVAKNDMKTEDRKTDDRKEEDKKIVSTEPVKNKTASDQQEPVKKEEVKETEKKKDPVTEEPVVKNDKTKNKKSSSFFLSVSAGPDVSSVGTDRPGKTKLLTGVGVGYTWKERLTVRTGFYTARKVYSATREDYKPAVTPPNYNYLDKITADCKVYEIPVSITYHFGSSKKQNFFAGAGLSSYLMKKEDYDYLYKYPGNPPVTYSHAYSYKNENNHLFSVLGISAGYQRNISKTISVMAEPYVRIPLSGVGHGNVKLNSGGVMFSVTIKPFQNFSKKN